MTREDAAAAAFDALEVPSTGLRADGTIVVANPAFVRLLRRDRREELEGVNIRDTVVSRLHPGLSDDLRLVALNGKLVRRRVAFASAAGKRTSMRLLMSPASGSCGDCMLTLYALPPRRR